MKLVKSCLGLIGVAVVVIVIIAVVASMGGSKKGASTASGNSSPSSPTHKASSSPASPSPSSSPTHKAKPKATNILNSDTGTPNKVKEGGAYTLGDFKIHKGWKVDKIGYGAGWSVKNLQVENITDSDHTFSVDIKLHKGAHVIVADMPCIADTAHPKDIVSVDCVPDGEEKPYDYITIENSF